MMHKLFGAGVGVVGSAAIGVGLGAAVVKYGEKKAKQNDGVCFFSVGKKTGQILVVEKNDSELPLKSDCFDQSSCKKDYDKCMESARARK